jgi:UDP-N-acetylglucosamine--N-acetylmuramyl-(pentapeptide) pyrophosphoryl-undecaprenol N-acetylglucosamine transferase
MAEHVRRRRSDARIMFVGTKGRIEARVVPSLGYEFGTIWISGFARRFSLQALVFPVKVLVALVQSFFLIRSRRPAAVVGTGGYVSGPVVYIASLLGVPTLIQEQNSYPGVTTRLLASRVNEVHLTYASSARYLKGARDIRITGNPVRDSIGTISRREGREFFDLNEQAPTLLLFGGSQGATSLNSAMKASLGEFSHGTFQVIWQTGRDDFGEARAVAEGAGNPAWLRVFMYIERMEFAYAASDLAVCRAGATTLAELTKAGVPSVLVPYPHAAADHQTENAKTMVGAGASVLLRDQDVREQFSPVVHRLLQDPGSLRRMSDRALSLARPEAASALAEAVLHLAEGRDVR